MKIFAKDCEGVYEEIDTFDTKPLYREIRYRNGAIIAVANYAKGCKVPMYIRDYYGETARMHHVIENVYAITANTTWCFSESKTSGSFKSALEILSKSRMDANALTEELKANTALICSVSGDTDVEKMARFLQDVQSLWGLDSIKRTSVLASIYVSQAATLQKIGVMPNEKDLQDAWNRCLSEGIFIVEVESI